MKFVNFLKSRIISNIILFLNVSKNKLFTYLSCAYLKKCFNLKSSTYYFHMNTKILADFQICISVTLKQQSAIICHLSRIRNEKTTTIY